MFYELFTDIFVVCRDSNSSKNSGVNYIRKINTKIPPPNHWSIFMKQILGSFVVILKRSRNYVQIKGGDRKSKLYEEYRILKRK